MEVFKCEQLTYCYPDREEPALKEINLSIGEGEFLLVMGCSGSGKSTLARTFNGIIPEFYGGTIWGRVTKSMDTGIVFQDPEKQLVMDMVEREMAFPLENMGIEQGQMRKRVLEALSFLNMHSIKDKKTYEISGGQKQKTAVGCVLAAGYRLLVLDEPTSQLDPVSAGEIFTAVKRLNEQTGHTIVLIEQRVERCFHLADRIIFMESGRVVFDGSPGEFTACGDKRFTAFYPPVSQAFKKAGFAYFPLTTKSARQFIEKEGIDFPQMHKDAAAAGAAIPGIIPAPAASLKQVSFNYGGDRRALRNINLEIYKSEIFVIMGESGGGKSTLLKLISGVLKPGSGKVKTQGIIGYLSQDPNDYLFNDTVYDELKYTLDNRGIKDDGIIPETAAELGIEKHLYNNPRDLSGGERQRVALASIMVMKPDIILLDEPTRGLDRDLKMQMGSLLSRYRDRGSTVLMATHDIEFGASIADRVCLLFDGSVAQTGTRQEVLDGGLYYTTQINRLFGTLHKNIFTIQDAAEFLKKGMV